MKNKRGSMVDLVIWLAIAFTIMMFFGLWYYSHGLLTDKLAELDTPIGTQGDTIASISADTFGRVQTGLNMLKVLAVVLIFSMVLTMFITNYYATTNPVFFFVYVAITITAVVISVIVSNTYETFLTNAAFGSTLQSFTAGSYIMLNLPYFTGVIGLLATLILFLNPPSTNSGGGVI